MAKQMLGHHPYQPDDAGVRELLVRASTPVGAAFISQLGRADSTRLVLYGLRLVVQGMRERSLDRLREGLLAIAVGAAVYTGDDRDLMIVLAVPHVAAGQLGVRPAEVFDAVADRFEAGWLPDLLRVFGARHDVTLELSGGVRSPRPAASTSRLGSGRFGTQGGAMGTILGPHVMHGVLGYARDVTPPDLPHCG